MRKGLIIFLILLSQITFAQKRDKWIQLGLFTGSIALNAIGSGLNYNNHKDLGHALEAASVGTMLIIPLVINVDKKKWIWYIGTYSLLRYGMFDPMYNLAKGRDIFYQGNTGAIDKISGNFSPQFIYTTKALAFVIGVTIDLKKF